MDGVSIHDIGRLEDSILGRNAVIRRPSERALQRLSRMLPLKNLLLRLYLALRAGIRGRRRLFNVENLSLFRRVRREFGTKFAINAAISRLIQQQRVEPLSVAQIDVISFGEALPMIETKVSVVVPTLNAGAQMRPLLAKLKNQDGIRECELIVVDSGSSDDTVGVARIEGATVVEIPPEDFTHAYSRNRGADLATGNYLLFMTQDAMPLTDRWLWEMVKVIEQNDIVAVSCGEYPRSNADLFYRVASWKHHQLLSLNVDRILRWDESYTSYIDLRCNAHISNVAMIINREIFDRYRFISPYGEDLELGIRLIKDGFKMGHLNSTRVLHSHTRAPYYFLRRAYVDTKTLAGFMGFQKSRNGQNQEQLYNDIISLYFVINDVSRSLADLKCPMSVDSLITATKQNLRVCGGCPTQFLLDEGLQEFIHGLTGFSEKALLPFDSSKNSLLAALEYDVHLVERYMSGVYGAIDDQILQEFIAALYKIFASKCGDQLASLYLKCTVKHEDGSFLSVINQELSKGI